MKQRRDKKTKSGKNVEKKTGELHQAKDTHQYDEQYYDEGVVHFRDTIWKYGTPCGFLVLISIHMWHQNRKAEITPDMQAALDKISLRDKHIKNLYNQIKELESAISVNSDLESENEDLNRINNRLFDHNGYLVGLLQDHNIDYECD